MVGFAVVTPDGSSVLLCLDDVPDEYGDRDDQRQHEPPESIDYIVHASFHFSIPPSVQKMGAELDHLKVKLSGKGQAFTSCLAKATSMLSPSWLSTSSPVSGISPDVDWETAIFLLMSVKHCS